MQRLSAFAKAQAEVAQKRRAAIERLTARGRLIEAKEVAAKADDAAARAADIGAVVAFARAAREADATRAVPDEAQAGRLATALAACKDAVAELEALGDAAGNAVAHLEQISPTANPALFHQNALNAFRWLELTAKAKAGELAASSAG